MIFGDFHKLPDKGVTLTELQKILHNQGMLLYLNKEFDFHTEIRRMLEEHPLQFNEYAFFLTSIAQKVESDDLLTPFSDYSQEELFPNGYNDRAIFERTCEKQLKPLETALRTMRDVGRLENLRVFISSGYDTEFEFVEMTIDELMGDLSAQACEQPVFDSRIYQIVEE